MHLETNTETAECQNGLAKNIHVKVSRVNAKIIVLHLASTFVDRKKKWNEKKNQSKRR